MGNSFNSSGGYRIEVSGWGVDSKFFVEKADLLWTSAGEKKVQLHRSLQQGDVVFVRLLTSEVSNNCVPVAYRIGQVEQMDCNGRCQMMLTQMHPRSKEPGQESITQEIASKDTEDARMASDVPIQQGSQREEILR